VWGRGRRSGGLWRSGFARGSGGRGRCGGGCGGGGCVLIGSGIGRPRGIRGGGVVVCDV
jgi:hypothetical protein